MNQEKEHIDISIVIPLLNEEESLTELFEWIHKTLDANYSFEVIFIDDGSTDKSWGIVEELKTKHSNIKAVKFKRNYGKSAALNTGFDRAEGTVVFTMDADLQDSPEEIPEMYDMIVNQGYDLVSGWKKIRHDPKSKTIPTKLFNAVTRKISGIQLHDFNCGLKAYRLELVKELDVYGEMHRYIPVLAKWIGYSKIGEKVVKHQPRKYGTSKFGLERFINGFLDLATVTFVTRFSKKPMHFFGLLGTIMFIIGFLVAFWLGAEKLYYLSQNVAAPLITSKPVFYIALTVMIIGTQLFLAGFIAEMITRNSLSKHSYIIEKEL